MRSVAAEFEQWLVEHPELWLMFETICAERIAAGHSRWAANAAREVLRWRSRAKFPNVFTPFMARYWLRLHPEHPKFFRCNASMADAPSIRQLGLEL